MSSDGDETTDYVPSAAALDFLQVASAAEHDSLSSTRSDSARRTSTLKKKKPKQMKIEKALRNMSKPPVNFQGQPLEKCTFVPKLNRHVFVHPSYSKAWLKFQKSPLFAPKPGDDSFCADCFLQPCSSRLLRDELEQDAVSVDQLLECTEEEHREKLRLCYRAQMAKLQTKKHINRQMPTNNDIPLCAKRIAAKIALAESGGYESLLESPF